MHHSPHHSMLPVYVLALSAFIFNTSEFIPVALLSDIGVDFAMKNEQVGLMMTVYAWLVAVLSLPLMLLTARIERKKLLIAVFCLFIVAHGVAYVASSFTTLLISRAWLPSPTPFFGQLPQVLSCELPLMAKAQRHLDCLPQVGR